MCQDEYRLISKFEQLIFVDSTKLIHLFIPFSVVRLLGFFPFHIGWSSGRQLEISTLIKGLFVQIVFIRCEGFQPVMN